MPDLPPMNDKPTVVALYLPQYHPIPENDEWWGKGFTEWSNVTKAKPLYRGHQQPDLPADLGFYDLRVPEVRQAQAELARAYGVGAFCYYHYWFGDGRRLLERPFEEVLSSGNPDFPFMLCWANETWSGVWHGLAGQTLIEQRYPGPDDEAAHFQVLLRAFRDPRYLRVQGKPVFMVYSPLALPNARVTLDSWRAMAEAAGLPGLYLIGANHDPNWNCREYGFDAFVNIRGLQRRRSWTPWAKPMTKIRNWWLDKLGRPMVVDYGAKSDYFVPSQASNEAIPCVLSNWDNTPRSGMRGLVMTDATPERFGAQLKRALRRLEARQSEDNLLFIKSWNEWAEGNHLEPGRRWGHAHLEVVRKALRQE